ncbi:uncharacterized protein LOC108627683 [Ceratina calcarata]|uniref:Uncharacterized protein LOC108627683 n=1 Tax=Ceratina calcarata TaxID=156304 RepID=A0AAJ7N9P3_9HYME|nr:uncharacterized protein LOC108627683 [Ceratina calcarata]
MWHVLLSVCTFKIVCIFVFIVYCVVTFLLIVYKAQTEELKKYIVPQEKIVEIGFPIEIRDSVDDKLEVLTEKLTEKERALQKSQCEIKNAEKVLSDLENKTSSCRDRYRSLMMELKKDIRKTEDEVRTLQNQISNLSIRREALRTEVLKQQEDYQKMLNNFSKELENKKTQFSSGTEKSRHSRVSCFVLP